MTDGERLRDRAGREVVLTETAVRHILERRRRLANRVADIRAAVETPDFVTRDSQYAHGENCYRRSRPDGPWTKVVVRYGPVPPQGTWAGRVITAYPTDHVGAEEDQLWP